MVDDHYKNFIYALIILLAFIFLVIFISFEVKNTSLDDCFCGIPLWLVVIIISLFGLFIGSFVYYILNKHYFKGKQKYKEGIIKTLNFLEPDERLIIKALLKMQGKATQKKVCELTGLNKVKVSRLIKKLQKKDLVKKQTFGMTNKLILDAKLVELFKEVNVSKIETNI